MNSTANWEDSLSILLEEMNMSRQQSCKGLVVSASDGQSRAIVSSQPAGNIGDRLEAALTQLKDRFGHPPKHLRLDLITSTEEIDWQTYEKAISQIKRNYLRLGLALDSSCGQAFLETELNAFACFNSGADIHHCQFNPNNFAKLFKHRFGSAPVPQFEANTKVWSFSTQSTYIGRDGNACLLEPSGLSTGRRQIMPLSANDALHLITQSSEFLGRMVQPQGEFIYGFFPCFDKRVAGYNTLRHCSSTYSMLEAWEVTRSETLMAAIERSINRITANFIKVKELAPGVTAAFLLDTGDEIKLGGNAVAILALVKYCQLTGTDTHRKLAEQLGMGIAAMMNEQTGRFVHVLNYPDLSVKEQFRIIYYDGEAAFALMRLYELTRNLQWVGVVEKAFEFFIAQDHWKAHDHWLSYCVNELTRIRPKREYFEFGLNNVAGYLDFVLERITTFPTLLELMMAAEQMVTRLSDMPEHEDLLKKLNLDKFYEALHHRAHYLLNGFFWPELAMFYQVPDSIEGSFFIRHHAFRVRNDDIEHYLSGFVAYRRFLLNPAKRERSRLLRIRSVRKPHDLAGQSNGRISAELLAPIRWGYLHKDAAKAWNSMSDAALADGVVLLPMSPMDTYRPYEKQLQVFMDRHTVSEKGKNSLYFDGKHWELKKGMMPSSAPGSSVHGWGLAVDVMLDDRCGYVLDWLREHADRFGFCWQLQQEPHHLVFYGYKDKALVLTEEQANEKPGLWTSEGLAHGTGGRWIRLPSPQFSPSGLCAYAPAFQPGQLVLLRATESQRGLSVTTIKRLANQASGVILQNQTLMEQVPKNLPVLLVQDNLKAVFRIAQAHRREFGGKVIGVTGSAGKTTVCHMIQTVLGCKGESASTSQSNANLPFGVAWNLCGMSLEDRFWVAELAIGGMKDNSLLARPDIAVLTNIGDSHLIYHKNRLTVSQRKSRILYGMPAGGRVVLNTDTPHYEVFSDLATKLGLTVIACGSSASNDYQLMSYNERQSAATLRLRDQLVVLDLSNFPGVHMAMNALLTLAVADASGMNRADSLKALEGFRLLAGRGELIQLSWPEVGTVNLIDDSYNANPESMVKSIQSVIERRRTANANRLVLVLGDMLELGPDEVQQHESLLESVLNTQADLVVTCGPLMEKLYRKAANADSWVHFENSMALSESIAKWLKPDDLVFVKGSNGSGLYKMIQDLRAAQ